MMMESRTPNIAEIADTDLGDLSRREICLRICRAASVKRNTPTSASLTKGELNSIAAFITGSHPIPPKHYGVVFTKTAGEIRELIADEIHIETFPGGDGDYAKDENGAVKRQFRKAELRELCVYVENNEDERL